MGPTGAWSGRPSRCDWYDVCTQVEIKRRADDFPDLKVPCSISPPLSHHKQILLSVASVRLSQSQAAAVQLGRSCSWPQGGTGQQQPARKSALPAGAGWTMLTARGRRGLVRAPAWREVWEVSPETHGYRAQEQYFSRDGLTKGLQV